MKGMIDDLDFPEKIQLEVRTSYDGQRTVYSPSTLDRQVLEAFANGSPRVCVWLSRGRLPIVYDLLHGAKSDMMHIFLDVNPDDLLHSTVSSRELTYIKQRKSDYASGKKRIDKRE